MLFLTLSCRITQGACFAPTIFDIELCQTTNFITWQISQYCSTKKNIFVHITETTVTCITVIIDIIL